MTTSSRSVPGRRTPPFISEARASAAQGCWKASRILCLHLVPLRLSPRRSADSSAFTTPGQHRDPGGCPPLPPGPNPWANPCRLPPLPPPCPAGAAPPVQLQDVGFGVQQATMGKEPLAVKGSVVFLQLRNNSAASLLLS